MRRPGSQLSCTTSLLLSYAEKSTNVGIAGVLIGVSPLITTMIAAAVLPSERATARKVVGLLVSFGGVVLVIGPWAAPLGSLGGRLGCLGAAFSYAIGFVYVRKFLSPRGLAPLSLATSQLLAAAVLQGMVAPFLAWHTPHFSGRSATSIIFLGVLTGLAYVLYFRLIATIGATMTSSVNYVVPVTATLIGAVFLREQVTWNLAVGGVVVLIGVAYAEDRIKRVRHEPESTPPMVEPAADRL